jgi:predicted RNase H-like HicB family nuclease
VAEDMNKQRFKIDVTEEGHFYLINFPDFPNLFTQATHLREIEIMAKDLVFLMMDIPLEAIVLDINFSIPVAITQ